MKKTSSVISILLALLMLFSLTAAAAGGNGGGSTSGTLTLESAKIGDTLLAEATEIRSNAEILLTFSANVTDESVLAGNISKIKVKDSTGNNVSSVTVSPSGNKKFTVALNGLEKADYTLSIGKDLKDTAGNTLGAKVEIPFTVNKGDGSGSGGGNNPLTFGGAKVGETDLNGAKLKGDETVVLQFDRGMKTYETDNAALIGVYKADGSKADYTVLAVDASDDVAKQQIKVQLNGLAAGEYTLKIDKDVKANNGNTLGTDVTVSFSVEAENQGSGDQGGSDSTASSIANLFKMILNYLKMFVDFITNLLGK